MESDLNDIERIETLLGGAATRPRPSSFECSELISPGEWTALKTSGIPNRVRGQGSFQVDLGVEVVSRRTEGISKGQGLSLGSKWFQVQGCRGAPTLQGQFPSLSYLSVNKLNCGKYSYSHFTILWTHINQHNTGYPNRLDDYWEAMKWDSHLVLSLECAKCQMMWDFCLYGSRCGGLPGRLLGGQQLPAAPDAGGWDHRNGRGPGHRRHPSQSRERPGPQPGLPGGNLIFSPAFSCETTVGYQPALYYWFVPYSTEYFIVLLGSTFLYSLLSLLNFCLALLVVIGLGILPSLIDIYDGNERTNTEKTWWDEKIIEKIDKYCAP